MATEVGSNDYIAYSVMPSATANAAVLDAAGSTDWASPLFPNVRSRRHVFDAAVPITNAEWAQMHFLMGTLNAAELEAGTTLTYSLAVMHFVDFLTRYPLETAFSKAHRATKAVFAGAVWGAAQIEQVLIHFVLHEVAVRGNGWSSVRGKLYGIRHHNIRHGQQDPLKDKLRLKQVMRALKKYRGPGAGKKPVDRAILLILEKMLHYHTSDDDLTLWAATLTAWHFMMRSSEHTAKRTGGKFDMDRVMCVCDTLKKMQGRIVRGHEDQELLADKPARDRNFMRWAAEQKAAKLRRRMEPDTEAVAAGSGLGSVA